MRRHWARWTTPITEGEVARKREAVLFSVLAGMVLLSAATAVVQGAGMLARGSVDNLPWIGVNAAVGAGFAVLLRVARAGQGRSAATALVSLFAALTTLLLIMDGSDHAMWAMLSAFTIVLATMLLGGRAGMVTVAGGAAVVLPIVVLQATDTIQPPAGGEAGTTGEVLTVVQILILLGVLTAICRLYTRDVLMTIDEQLAGAGADSPLRQLRTRTLTMREMEVVRLIADGRSNDAIAAELFLSPRTVHTHVTNAMRKCACSNRTELGVLAVREGLVPLEAPTPTEPSAARARTPSAR